MPAEFTFKTRTVSPQPRPAPRWEWVCLECRHVFKSVRAAERAANEGCPNCGGVDIDQDLVTPKPQPAAIRQPQTAADAHLESAYEDRTALLED